MLAFKQIKESVHKKMQRSISSECYILQSFPLNFKTQYEQAFKKCLPLDVLLIVVYGGRNVRTQENVMKVIIVTSLFSCPISLKHV